jgi:hypothetical protein
MSKKLTFGLSILVFCVTAFIAACWLYRAQFSDLYIPLCSARALVQGKDPYNSCIEYSSTGVPLATYPLPMFMFLIPFSFLPRDVAVCVIWGLSNSFLFYGILHSKRYYLFLIFLSGVYWSISYVQQITLFVSTLMLFPCLTSLAIIKPQIGIPVLFTNLTKGRIFWVLLFIGLSFVIYPKWPLVWYQYTRTYRGVIPILSLPLGIALTGFLGLSVIQNKKENKFALLLACMPQLAIYDTVGLFFILKNRRQVLILCLSSWILVFINFIAPSSPLNSITGIILFCYIPVLLFQIVEYLESRHLLERLKL